MLQKLFTHFLSRKRFTHSIWKVFARDTLPTGKVWFFMSLLLTISHRHLGLRLSSVPVVSTVEIQRAVSQEETSDQKDPGSVFSDFFIDLLITDFLRCPLDFDNGAWTYGKKQEEYKFPNATTTRWRHVSWNVFELCYWSPKTSQELRMLSRSF